MQITGRNDPCPCGSGRKFKHCCGRQGDALQAELREFLSGTEFDSLEDLQARTDAFMLKSNRRPIEDFHGLSSDQMQHILDTPFDSPRVAVISDRVKSVSDAPFIKIFGLLAEAVGTERPKPTVKGNLPRQICIDIAASCWNHETIPYETYFPRVHREEDFEGLHVVRVVAELAGFLRKYKGRFILGRKCRDLLDRSGVEAVYRPLFDTFVRTFNWGYSDGYPDLLLLQKCFLYSLYLLQRFGGDGRPDTFYSDQFLRAFPSILHAIPEETFTTRERTLHHVYSLRVLKRFACFMGLARVEAVRREGPGIDYRVKTMPLLGELVQFKV